MKATILVFGAVIFSTVLFAQVGIGNTAPKSILDIKASNQSTPTNQDGILIPRLDIFPDVDPTVDQHGMLIFLTTTDAGKTPGFYYWDFPTLSWIGLESSSASSNISVVNIEDFLFDAYSGAKGPNTAVSNDNQYAFTPAATSGATSTIESAVTGNGYMGIHQLSSGSNTNGKAAVASSDWDDKIRLGTNELLYEIRVQFTLSSASAGPSVGVFGLSNLVWNSSTAINSHTSTSAGVYFNYSSAGLVGMCKNGGSTSSTSAIAITANQWYKLKAVINGTGTGVDFYVDGVKLGSTITTNIPSSTAGMKLLSTIERLGGGSVVAANLDYITWKLTR